VRASDAENGSRNGGKIRSTHPFSVASSESGMATLAKRPLQEPWQYQRRTDPRKCELSLRCDSVLFTMSNPLLPTRNSITSGCLPSHEMTYTMSSGTLNPSIPFTIPLTRTRITSKCALLLSNNWKKQPILIIFLVHHHPEESCHWKAKKNSHLTYKLIPHCRIGSATSDFSTIFNSNLNDIRLSAFVKPPKTGFFIGPNPIIPPKENFCCFFVFVLFCF